MMRNDGFTLLAKGRAGNVTSVLCNLKELLMSGC